MKLTDLQPTTIIEEQRPDVFNLPLLARRHFGPATQVTPNEQGGFVVTPGNAVNMSNIGGFMAEVKRLNLVSSYDKNHNVFVVAPNPNSQ